MATVVMLITELMRFIIIRIIIWEIIMIIVMLIIIIIFSYCYCYGH